MAVRDGSGGVEAPIKAGVAPTASLNGTRHAIGMWVFVTRSITNLLRRSLIQGDVVA